MRHACWKYYWVLLPLVLAGWRVSSFPFAQQTSKEGYLPSRKFGRRRREEEEEEEDVEAEEEDVKEEEASPIILLLFHLREIER